MYILHRKSHAVLFVSFARLMFPRLFTHSSNFRAVFLHDISMLYTQPFQESPINIGYPTALSHFYCYCCSSLPLWWRKKVWRNVKRLSETFTVSPMSSVCVCVSLACIAALCSAVAGWLSRWGMTICKWALSLTTMKRLMQLIFHYVPSPQILIILNHACGEQKSGICNSEFRQLHWELFERLYYMCIKQPFCFHLGSAMKPWVLIKS